MASRGSSSPSTLPIAIAMAAVMTVVASGLCPARCRCDDESLRVSCAYAGLEVVPIQLNPEIRHLDLSNNRVTNVHLTFGFYGNLESLDLSSNLLHTLGLANFGMQQNLIALNISSNMIHTLARNALDGLTSLKELNLASNNISEISEQAFKSISELEVLDLSDNSITSLSDELLKNLHKIRALILNKNSLLEVPTNNLALAPSLERVDLSDNLILELDRDSLPSLPSLISLNLSNNVIRYIADVAFDRLPDLRYLDLSGNNLTSVPTAALARLNVLTGLVLSTNPLGYLEAVAFRNLFELRILDLNDCMIAYVNARAFADNVNLERISMDGNRELKELPARVLYGARYLKWVSLRRCSLATLQPTQFPVDGLSHLRVGGNPLVCNCSVHWLWNVIRAEERRNETRLELDTHDIVCTDEEFAGRALIALSEGSLRCRLSPLYLSLSAAGCFLAAAAVLTLIARLTRAKRKRQSLAYAAPNRPEFLVYVGRGDNRLDKSAESYSRRLLARNNEDMSYDSPRGKVAAAMAATTTTTTDYSPQSRETNIYETPRYAHPGRRDAAEPTLQGKQPPVEEGVYAVADVTDLRDEPPEVLSLYRARSPPPVARSNALRRLDYSYDYEYDYDYGPTAPPSPPPSPPPPLSEKPHVVFV
ncbi:Leucine-rich repeat and immunoglobulin-like domain-containing nogo receptor-interacting protein 1 [Trachymyrmex septentrionalis]|uniref:Leucine-rich repeat and immunoglobulin-like domain-containing nogo receptor-interacting protein 1 n=1 Tax=Trachymyrmex septentrionalis TaxID=34720 RepID=A0A151JZA2_9HYME|nr:PREDICTED: protein artichoke-like [Trachymyrmex septentrionalis]KYN41760.1 Leucine-rich repeat and immunoglobulin-like domain-containing nogo receptor-interacting protein 1 [Trachymyrmex septentrionalis]